MTADRCERGRLSLVTLIDEQGSAVPVCETCLDAGLRGSDMRPSEHDLPAFRGPFASFVFRKRSAARSPPEPFPALLAGSFVRSAAR